MALFAVMCEESFPFMGHHLYLPVIVASCPHGFIYYLRKYHSDLNDIVGFFVFSSRQIVRVPRNKIHKVLVFILSSNP